MDLQGFVNMLDISTCIISVETKEDGSYGDIRIVAGNNAYISSIEHANAGIARIENAILLHSFFVLMLS